MSPDDSTMAPIGELIARTLTGSVRAALQERLQLVARQAAEIGVPGDTLDGWFDEAREEFRRRGIEMANARDGVA